MAYINHDVSTMAMPSGMNRMGQFPLDMSSVYYDEASLKAYAESGSIAYVGQIVSLVDETNNKVTVYSIQDTAGTLKEVGTIPLGDNKSVEVVDGKIALHDFGKVFYKYIAEVVDEEGNVTSEARYDKTTVSDENPWKAGLEPKIVTEDGQLVIGWFEPNPTTIEGVNDQVTAIQGTVADLETSVGVPSGENQEATGLYKEVEDVQTDVTDLQESIYGEGGTAEKPVEGSIADNVNDLKDTVGTEEDSLGEDVNTLWANVNDHDTRLGTLEAIDHNNFKTKQEAYSVTGTVITSISQNENGEITATTGEIDTGVMNITGEGAIQVNGAEGNYGISLNINNQGNVVLTQEQTEGGNVGLSAKVDLSEYLKSADETKYGIEYDSANKVIKLTNDTSKTSIDATDFIKDGMISSVELVDNDLVITWNTDAGIDATTIPLDHLIDAYTAEGTDGTTINVTASTTGNAHTIAAEVKAGSLKDAHIAADAAIAKSKLADDVQASLGKADSALQAHQDISHLATKAEVEAVDKKFENYTTTEALGNLLDEKQDVIAEGTYATPSDVNTAIETAAADATSKASAAKEAAIADADSKIGNLETALDARLDVLEAIDHTLYATKEALDTTDDIAKDAQNRVDIVEGKIDEITSVGGEPNVIEKIKVNNVTLEVEKDSEGKSTKSVNITVPTKFSDLTDDSGFDARITAAQNKADEARAAAATNATAIENTGKALDATNEKVTALESLTQGHTTKITNLESFQSEHTALYNALNSTVSEHGTKIAGLEANKADKTALEAAVNDIAKNTSAITTLNETTIPGINEEVAKKANITDLYTKQEIDDMVTAAGDTSALEARVKTNEDAIAAIDFVDDDELAAAIKVETDRADAEEKRLAGLIAENATAIAGNTAVINSILGNEDETDLNSIAELAAWINEHGTEASGMAEAIEENAAAITGLTSTTGTHTTEIDNLQALVGADALAEGDSTLIARIAALEGAGHITAADLGNDGAVGVSTDRLLNGAEELVFSAGNASGYNTEAAE